MERFGLIGLILCEFLIAHVAGYPNGLVSSVCDTMIPNHNANSQTSAPPYTVTVSHTSFTAGDRITVTLQGISSTFRGFLLQARSLPGDNIVGNFEVTNSTSQTLNCDGSVGAAVSHTDRSDKSSTSAVWTAPAGTGNIRFRVTFVQTVPVFWAGVESPLLTVISSSTQSSVSSSAPPDTSPSLPSLSSSGSSPLPPTSVSRASCGLEKVCFSSPTDCDPSTMSNCFFMSSAPVSGGGYWFEISGPSDGYVAIGFSDDTQMGNDDIYICGMNSAGTVQVQHAYSEGKVRPRILALNNVEVSLASFSSGVMQCSFMSRNNISTQTPTRASSNSFYIFLAYGASVNGVIQFHGTTGTSISSTKIDLLVAANVSSSQSSGQSTIKAHGTLMLIAWMTTGSLGMIIARYLKVAAKQLVFGKALWFQAHITLMALTIVATIISFVLAFVKAQGWSYRANTHAILGCIVMILAFFQPFIAFFRPSPQSSRRFIFNWFHALNALVMKVLAVANLFLGLQFLDYTINWLVKVMGGFVGWEVLTLIILEMNARLMERDMKEEEVGSERSQSTVKTELILLLIYLCGNLTFLIALLVGIAQS
ncbi:putative ferric-chelate reductase 1 isoform X4 [Ascaphus truei]